METTVIVPAYNEYSRLELLYSEWKEIIQDYNFILVDDGSEDSTSKIAKEIGFQKIICLPQNMGKGYAVRIGILEALKSNPKPDFVGFSDADLSVSPDQWPGLIRKLADYDIAIASRHMANSQVQRGLLRSVMSSVYSSMAHTILHLDISDTQCGLKFFRANIAQKLFAEPLKFNGFAFDLEILMRAKINNFSIAEVPVKWIEERKYSKVSFKTSWQMFVALIKLAKMYGTKSLSPGGASFENYH